ncbi:MAG: DnaA regulatory inactivator Hda [Gammaproteobacteria bacterium]|jgi:DnaA family protein|nr:DnaA regulatory inactivator Hda [Gammaproteobacteria bacterium]
MFEEAQKPAQKELSPQLSLGLELSHFLTFENFYPGKNQQVVQTLQDFASNKTEKFIYLYGGEGVGKTHLLQATCHQVLESQQSAIYVSLKKLDQYAEAILDNLHSLSLVCIDDIEQAAKHGLWEEKLFILFNEIYEHKGRLLIAANALPNQLGMKLNDLVSRLNWGLTFKVQTLEENEKVEALKQQAYQAGLVLSDEVAQFLISRVKRDMGSLLEAFKILNQASITEKHRLTVPFVKKVLDL